MLHAVHGRGGLARGGRGHFSPAAMYCITTWCFALKGLRTMRKSHNHLHSLGAGVRRLHLEVEEVELHLLTGWRHHPPHAVEAVRVGARVARGRQLALRHGRRQLQLPPAHHRNLPEGKPGQEKQDNGSINSRLLRVFIANDFTVCLCSSKGGAQRGGLQTGDRTVGRARVLKYTHTCGRTHSYTVSEMSF